MNVTRSTKQCSCSTCGWSTEMEKRVSLELMEIRQKSQCRCISRTSAWLSIWWYYVLSYSWICVISKWWYVDSLCSEQLTHQVNVKLCEDSTTSAAEIRWMDDHARKVWRWALVLSHNETCDVTLVTLFVISLCLQAANGYPKGLVSKPSKAWKAVWVGVWVDIDPLIGENIV